MYFHSKYYITRTLLSRQLPDAVNQFFSQSGLIINMLQHGGNKRIIHEISSNTLEILCFSLLEPSTPKPIIEVKENSLRASS